MAENGSDYRSNVTIAATAVVMALSTLIYGLRILARHYSKASLRIDDYTMGVGLFLSYGIAICNFVGVANGLGRHQSTLTKEQLRNVLIVTFALEKIWSVAMFFVKSSIILLYMRLFYIKRFTYFSYFMLLFSFCWMLSGFIGNLLQCMPPKFFYDKSIPGGTCRNGAPFFIAIGTISFVEDLVILSMPMPVIWKLNINTRKKVVLTGIFLLGAFVCVTSVLRLTTFRQLRNDDITYTNVFPGLWTYIELGVGSICGSLPLLRPIFGRLLGLGNGSSQGYDYDVSVSRARATSRAYSTNRRSKFERIDPVRSGHSRIGIRSQPGTTRNPNPGGNDSGSDEIELVGSSNITVHTEIKQEVVEA